MKLKLVEIEATAEELKASNGFADALSNQLRNIFNPLPRYNFADADKEDEE